MAEAIDVLRKQGAMIIDPADIPSVVAADADSNVLRWGVCAGLSGAKGKDQNCSTVFKYGMKRDFNRWLATLGPAAPVKSLAELRQFNLAHQAAGASSTARPSWTSQTRWTSNGIVPIRGRSREGFCGAERGTTPPCSNTS
jgi:hypothetical protein